MRTHTSLLQDTFPFLAAIPLEVSAEKRKIGDLLKLQRAAREITSILDLDALLESIVTNVVCDFGGIEASVWLKDPERDELVLASAQGCTLNGKGARLRIGVDGLVGQAALTGKTYYAPDVSVEPNYIACEAEISAELCIPLLVGGRLIGTFSIAHPEIDGFPPDQIELLEGLAGHIAVAVENARVFQEERAAKLQLQREQQEAGRIQRELLPKTSPLIPGLQIESSLVPARVVAGDWYDYIALPDGRWALVIADVSGKGMAAALVMASVRAMLRAIVRHSTSPADILTKLNRILIDDLPPERFVTMIVAVYDPRDHSVRFANAGHLAPLWIHPDGAGYLNTDPHFPLGLFDTVYAESEIKLASDARLVFYTDGVIEAESPAGEEFGGERLLKLALTPATTSADIVREACRFAGNGHAQDDATVIMLRRSA